MDNNASFALGPFLRLFDAPYAIADVRQAEISLRIKGEDGFVLQGHRSMAGIMPRFGHPDLNPFWENSLGILNTFAKMEYFGKA